MPPVTTPRPLADSEKLPVQKHRDAETSKSPERQDIAVVEKKSKKPKRKEKKHKEKEREKKKKEAEKVRDQAACVTLGGAGPGCQLPLFQGGSYRTVTHGSWALPQSSVTPPGHVVSAGARSRGGSAGRAAGSVHTRVLRGCSGLCLAEPLCPLRAAALAKGVCSCGFRVWT